MNTVAARAAILAAIELLHRAVSALGDDGWFEIAKSQIGVEELRGSAHNPQIIKFHSVTSLSATTDEVPWCASFVCWCLEQARVRHTNSARARDFMRWGVPIDDPVPGCIVVLWRGSPVSDSGHVGFWVSETEDEVSILGGNQSDSVRISNFPRERILGYRMPA